MPTTWTIQKEFEFQIMTALDTVNKVRVEQGKIHDNKIQITIREKTYNNKLVIVRIPEEDDPEVVGFGWDPDSQPTSESERVRRLEDESNPWYMDEYVPLRTSVLKTVKRAIDTVNRDFAIRNANRTASSSGGINIYYSNVRMEGNMIGGNETLNGDKRSHS